MRKHRLLFSLLAVTLCSNSQAQISRWKRAQAASKNAFAKAQLLPEQVKRIWFCYRNPDECTPEEHEAAKRWVYGLGGIAAFTALGLGGYAGLKTYQKFKTRDDKQLQKPSQSQASLAVVQSNQQPREFRPYESSILYGQQQEGSIFDAIKKGNISLVGKIIKAHPNWIVKQNEQGNLPIHQAVLSPSTGLQMIGLLLNAGADINAKNKKGETPLFLAAMKDNPDLVAILIKHGARVDEPNDTGLTPFYVSKDITSMGLLLDAGADINAQNQEGQTLLSFAASLPDRNLLNFLIKRHADIDKPDYKGNTPLLKAVGARNKEVIQELICAGASLDSPNIFEDTPLTLPERLKDQDMIDFLQKIRR